MNVLKRLISITAVCLMLFTSSLVAFGASEEALETQTAFLSAIGVENVNTSVTNASASRGDAAKYLAQAIGMSADYPAKEIFSDVAVDSAYASAVTYLYDLEIINGNSDGTFRPDENVTYGQFVKMAVSALGYKDYAGYKGGWTRGYLDCAKTAGLLKGVVESGDFTKGKIFTILYNMLHANMLVSQDMIVDKNTGDASFTYTSGEVYMKHLYGLTQKEGIVTASSTGTISGNDVMTDDTIKIDYKSYSLETPVAGDYSGMNVVYYLNENDNVQFVIPEDNTIYTVLHDKIRPGTTTSNFEYEDENDNVKNLKIASNAYYAYNGAEFFPHDSDLKPAYGRVELIDNNNDKKIDVVKVIEYKDYYVKGVSDGKLYVDDNADGIHYIDFEKGYDRVVFMNMANEVISSLLVSSDSVISVCASKGNELCTIHVSNDVFDGTIITITSDQKATIDDYEYEVYGNIDLNKYLGQYAKFYLDVDGAIVKVDLEKEEKYAVLQGAMLAGKPKEDLKLRFYDSGKFVEYDCSKKIKLSQDGGQTFTSKKGKDAYDIIKPLYEADKKQLIQYVLKDGVVDKLIFAQTNIVDKDNVPNTDVFQLNKKSTPDKEYNCYREYIYNSTDSNSESTKELIRFHPRKTMVYMVGDTEKTCNYGTAEDLGFSDNAVIYNFKAYDMTDTYITQYIVVDASVTVLPTVDWNSGSTQIGYIVSDKMIANEDGEPIHVYETLCMLSNGSAIRNLKTSKDDLYNSDNTNYQATKQYTGGTINFQNLEPGTVIMFTKNDILDEVNGFIVLSKPEDLTVPKANEKGYTGANLCTVTQGTVVEVDDEGCLITNNVMPKNCFGQNHAILTRCSTYPQRDLIAKWDVKNQKMTTATWDDITPGCTLWNYTGGVYSYGGRAFIIIEE